MLRYTRHPFVDVGAAAITAYVGKSQPEEIDRQDLDKAAEFIEHSYTKNPLKSFLTAIFPNSGYVNPTIGTEKLAAFMRRYLYAFRSEEGLTGTRCAYCGQEANVQVFRQHVPLLTGEGTLNFFPAATPGLPTCGYCLLCIQAFPLGATKSGGRALIIHSDNEEIVFRAAKNFLDDNLNYLQMQDVTKYPDQKFPRTIFVDQLLRINEQYLVEHEQSPSVTLYHLTNYGTNPDVNILHLPSQTVDFLRIANSGMFVQTWREIARHAWQKTEDARAGTARNFLYEDLFDLPERAGRFVRVYFLRRGFERTFKDDPRREYTLERDLDLISWDLTAMFLREVMAMERERIEAIKELGDRLSSYVSGTNGKKFFGDFYRSNRYGELRGMLIKASSTRIKKDEPPLIGFDEFITIFEDGEELPRIDWRLARDLVLIRMIEQLHEWLKNEEVVPEEAPGDQAAEGE